MLYYSAPVKLYTFALHVLFYWACVLLSTICLFSRAHAFCLAQAFLFVSKLTAVRTFYTSYFDRAKLFFLKTRKQILLILFVKHCSWAVQSTVFRKVISRLCQSSILPSHKQASVFGFSLLCRRQNFASHTMNSFLQPLFGICISAFLLITPTPLSLYYAFWSFAW